MILKFGLYIANLVHVREDSREVGGKSTYLVFKKDVLITGIIFFFMLFFFYHKFCGVFSSHFTYFPPLIDVLFDSRGKLKMSTD